jgi:thioredoxin-dependent peroxiredoxin
VVGDLVEDFVLKDQDGNDFSLYGNLDKKILLVFYPKDNSTVCNLQLTNYDNNYDAFEKNDIKVIGINITGVAEHKSFCEQKGFKFPLLSDHDKTISSRFDALNLLGQNKRKLVLIGTDRKVLYEKAVLSFLYINSDQILKSLKELEIR